MRAAIQAPARHIFPMEPCQAFRPSPGPVLEGPGDRDRLAAIRAAWEAVIRAQQAGDQTAEWDARGELDEHEVNFVLAGYDL